MRVGNHMVFVLINCTDNMDNSCFKTLKSIFSFILVFVSINSCFKVQLTFWSRSDGSLYFHKISQNSMTNAGVYCRDSHAEKDH